LKRHSLLRFSINVLIILIVVPIVMFGADCAFFARVVQPQRVDFNKGKNGLWMRSRMYMGKLEAGEVERMSEIFRKEQIGFAYFHCRDIRADGGLRFEPSASLQNNVSALRAANPKTKIIAWIGAVNKQNGGEVDLAIESVRRKMASEAARLVKTCGFDGVQWDFENCLDGNKNHVDLLKLTRKALPADSHLSTDANVFWSQTYIRDVAHSCDQIAIMAYDTRVFWPRLYASFMQYSVLGFAKALEHDAESAHLMIGVPTYEEPTPMHHPWAESLKVALIGTNAAISDPKCNRQSLDANRLMVSLCTLSGPPIPMSGERTKNIG
jgi:hypothetical protein